MLVGMSSNHEETPSTANIMRRARAALAQTTREGVTNMMRREGGTSWFSSSDLRNLQGVACAALAAVGSTAAVWTFTEMVESGAAPLSGHVSFSPPGPTTPGLAADKGILTVTLSNNTSKPETATVDVTEASAHPQTGTDGNGSPIYDTVFTGAALQDAGGQIQAATGDSTTIPVTIPPGKTVQGRFFVPVRPVPGIWGQATGQAKANVGGQTVDLGGWG
jgi:hypothetical protein